MGLNDKPELFAQRSAVPAVEGEASGGEDLRFTTTLGLPPLSWLEVQPPRVSQPAGAARIRLIKTDSMIETQTLFITLHFHTRQDSSLFHLRAFICRNEECVPIFKLTPSPFPPFVKMLWRDSFFFFVSVNSALIRLRLVMRA